MKSKQMKILVVDDEDALRFSLASILELEGYEVKSASTGFEAIEIASKESFDILISDIRMPGITGTETFQRIRKIQPDIIGIMMTAYALNDLITQALNAGAFACLSKPFEVEVVLSTITDVISRPFAVVVDDDDKLNSKFLICLKNSGLNVATAQKDIEKISFMLNHKPDVLILGIDKDFKASKLIFQNLKDLLGTIPKVILVYDESEMINIDDIKKLGIANFVKRPVSVKDVFQFLDKDKRKTNVAMINMNADEFVDLKSILLKKGFNLFQYDTSNDFFDELKDCFFDTVLINTHIEKDIPDFHEKLQQEMPNLGAIYVLNSNSNVENVAKKAYFYVVKPLDIDKIVELIHKITSE
ncbi:MAG: response regulator [Endomicrobiaceae bacterium]|nr:response regulator [Endomicrobiaceae bacterium]